MRRVVVTGMGIVSPIGNSTEEVLASLREARSGITASEPFKELGFRSQVHGAPALDPGGRPRPPRHALPRRPARPGTHVAMDQAIRDAGLEPADISNPRTGIIMGSGGPSTRTIVEAADIARAARGRRSVGPFAVPKAMSSTASATLATWFKIKGVELFDLVGLRDLQPLHRQCLRDDRSTASRTRCSPAAARNSTGRLSVLFDAMGAMSSKLQRPPAVASRAYDKNRDGFVIAGGAGVARARGVLEHAKARGAKIYGEIVGYGLTSDGYDMVAPSGEGAERCMRMALSRASQRRRSTTSTRTRPRPGIGDLKEIEADAAQCLRLGKKRRRSRPPSR